MNNQTIDQILKLNSEFYQLVGNDFDKSRQCYQKGWDNVIKIIDEEICTDKPLNILDISCGNGRLLNFLLSKENYEHLLRNFNYLGIDNNQDLINKFNSSSSNNNKSKNININKVGETYRFENIDTIKNFENFTSNKIESFDIVFALGITHHIPSKEKRLEWFRNVSDLCTKGGFIIFTFWNFDKEKSIDKKSNDKSINREISKIIDNFEENDYLLGWGNKDNVFRYCHYYNESELSEIINMYRNYDIKLINKFSSDGKNNNSNIYLIFRK